jgi:nucleotide-binding universal stress UspA family protein
MLTKHIIEDRAILNPKASRTETTMRLTRILVPVDFSPESKNALRYAAAFARQFGASMTLLHVVEPIVCSADFGYGPVTRCSANNDLLRKAKTRLRLLTNKLAVSRPKIAIILRTGVAETEIVAAARDLESDLIVMGTRGDCIAGQTTIGSTAEQVVRHAPCPVFIVRKKEHEFVSSRKSR